MSTFLLEINSPSMPATEIASIDLAIGKIFTNHFASIGLVKKSAPMVAMCTYGRIVVTCEDMQDMSSVSVRGPKTSSPPQAVDGFLKKYNANKKDLTIEGDYYVFTQTNTSEDIEYAIKDATIECLNQCALEWKSTLSIGGDTDGSGGCEVGVGGSHKWVRPISSIVCLFNEKVVNFKFCGVESSNLAFFGQSGNQSAQGEPVEILSLKHYLTMVDKHEILLKQSDRVAKVTEMINETCDKEGISCDLSKYQYLLQEVCAMVESPCVFVGEIPKEYNDVPNCTKVYTMANDQRYFPCLMRAHAGHANVNDDVEQFCNFIFISNKFYSGTPQRRESVIKGNQTVLNARLADQKFYWEQDLKKWQGKNEEEVRKMLSSNLLNSCNEIWKYMESYLQPIMPNGQSKNDDLAFAKAFVIFAKLDMETKCVLDMPEVRGFIGSHMWRLWCKNIVEHKEEYAKTMEFQHTKSPIQIADFKFKTLICPIFLMCNALNHIVHHVALGHIPTPSGDPYTVKRAADMFIIAQEALKKTMESQGIALNQILQATTPINDDTFDILKKAIVRVNNKTPLIRLKALNTIINFARKNALNGEAIGQDEIDEIKLKLNSKALQALAIKEVLNLKQKKPTCAAIDLMVEFFNYIIIPLCLRSLKFDFETNKRTNGMLKYKGDQDGWDAISQDFKTKIRRDYERFNNEKLIKSFTGSYLMEMFGVNFGEDFSFTHYNGVSEVVNPCFEYKTTGEERCELERLALETLEKAGFKFD